MIVFEETSNEGANAARQVGGVAPMLSQIGPSERKPRNLHEHAIRMRRSRSSSDADRHNVALVAEQRHTGFESSDWRKFFVDFKPKEKANNPLEKYRIDPKIDLRTVGMKTLLSFFLNEKK